MRGRFWSTEAGLKALARLDAYGYRCASGSGGGVLSSSSGGGGRGFGLPGLLERAMDVDITLREWTEHSPVPRMPALLAFAFHPQWLSTKLKVEYVFSDKSTVLQELDEPPPGRYSDVVFRHDAEERRDVVWADWSDPLLDKVLGNYYPLERNRSRFLDRCVTDFARFMVAARQL